ncbi:MAG: hypothetical protein WB615_05000 [Candidatus Tumulicola sp.]
MREAGLRTALRGVAFALLLPAVGCSGSSGGGSPYGTGDPKLAAPNPGGGPIDPFLTDGQAVLHALDAIGARSGRPLRVTSMTADGVNGLTVDVQEPAHPTNVDQYKITPDGTLSGPTPVRLMSLNGGPITQADVDRKAFDPRAVGFARLETTAREGIAQSKYPDARVSEWDFDGMHADDRRFMYFDAARARPAAELGPHLTIVALRF